MEWAILPFKRYADFSGRSRRREYWSFALLNVVIVIALLILGAVMSGVTGDDNVGFGIMGVILLVYCLAIIVPTLAAQVRRFHDQDKSGWFVLLGLIPLGGLVVLIFMFIEGTRGPNQYGPDPKADPALAQAAAAAASSSIPPFASASSAATPAFCSSCGNKLPAGAKFCMGCGKPTA
jgi:uncharacterized membrane protein YhaH (DUF805 family)